MDNSSKKIKKLNPVEKANIISRLTFYYMLPIFKCGFKNGLTEDDLYQPLDEHKSSILGDKLETIFREEQRKHKKRAFYRALWKLFGPNFLLLGTVRLMDELLLVVLLPLSIGKLVTYFEAESQITDTEAYIYASLIILCRSADAVIAHGSMMGLVHLAMKMRVACSALIYRKVLKLNRNALADTTIGQLVNLLSNDVSKFDQGFSLANFAWLAPIQAVVGTYFLYQEMGVCALYGMALLLSTIPLQIWIGKKCSRLRHDIALKTDIRVRLMNEVISGIHVIKMYCWEKPFGQLISLVRREEVKGIRSRGYLLGLGCSFQMYMTRVVIFVTILTYVLLGNYISARKIFVVTAIYAVLRPAMTGTYSMAVNAIAEVNVSVKRIQDFLSLEELQDEDFKKPHLDVTLCGKLVNENPKISLKSVSARWTKASTDSTLRNINLEITSNQLVAVIGAVGSGKSSLFNVILKELPVENGTVIANGEISYCSQEPWLFNASVRQNILFNNEYDTDRYEKVVKICALESDFKLLPHGDKTLVGERGSSLSGGQKARINLARCIYKDADIYLLDDPLSAVDANVGRHMYENGIKEFLKDKICILNTHQLQYLTNADKIIVLDDGAIEMEGNYSELQQSGLVFTKLMIQLHKDEKEKEEAKETDIRPIEHTTAGEEVFRDGPLLEEETMESADIKFSLYWSYFKAGGGLFSAIFMLFLFFGAQGVVNSADYFVTFWVDVEEEFRKKVLNNESNATIMFSRDDILYAYSGIILVAIIFGIGHGIYFMFFFSLASSTLHNISFSRIMKATMGFFNKNPSGRILNRFSRDMGNVDEYIPSVTYEVFLTGLDFFGAIILSMIVNYWLCIPSILFLLIFYGFRKVYIGTSRSVKRIESIARSPIFSHMGASVYGLSTVRAFSAQSLLIREFDEYQDKHSSAFYIFLASNRCFGFWIDSTTIVFTALAIFFFLYFKQNFYGGDIGLVITQLIGLAGGLQWGLRQWSELENQMVSVERILEYRKIETDPDNTESGDISKNWPENGQIEFCDVSLKYSTDDPPVLKNLNFTIKPKEKVGIVGRTGAGKSSTITALFQLYPVKGKILIDGVNATELPLEQVRSKISIIPQEPVLFSGTMRKNLDPFEEYTDETLWSALEQVEMKDVIAELSQGLESYVSEGGTNFSVGQRQLICLARALIRNNKILVMDEATANVDPYTDALIQNTIREKFADCTVLTIAHRLHTIMDSDRILVMSAGAVEEFDHPYCLLSNKEGLLHKMVQTTGHTSVENLINVARENYHKQFGSGG